MLWVLCVLLTVIFSSIRCSCVRVFSFCFASAAHSSFISLLRFDCVLLFGCCYRCRWWYCCLHCLCVRFTLTIKLQLDHAPCLQTLSLRNPVHFTKSISIFISNWYQRVSVNVAPCEGVVYWIDWIPYSIYYLRVLSIKDDKLQQPPTKEWINECLAWITHEK